MCGYLEPEENENFSWKSNEIAKINRQKQKITHINKKK
jgi:hypothetical protein